MSDLTISGGATSIDARTDDMRALADVLDGRGDVLRDIAGRIGRIAIDETVLSSQLLSPLTGADVLAKVVVAELPPHGVLWVALEFEARAVFLRGAAFLYDETDAALALLAELGTGLVGVVIINVAVVTAVTAVAETAAAAVVLAPGAALRLLAGDQLPEIPTDDLLSAAGDAAQGALFDHPWITESVIAGLPAYLSHPALSMGPAALLPAVPTSYESILAAVIASGGGMAGWFRQGEPVVEDRPGALRNGPAESTAAIFQNLSDTDSSDTTPSELRVTAYPDGTGGHTWLVEIPGTQQWSPQGTDNPSDLGANLHALAGSHDTAVQQAVEEAIQRSAESMAATHGSDVAELMASPVTLAGYSQGGIIAARLASDPSSDLNVTQVVTGGSPVGNIDVPADVAVLSIEHDQDVIPQLDGSPNPATANHTTVSRDLSGTDGVERGDLLGAHVVDSYRDTAEMLDASTDPTIVGARHGLDEQFSQADGATVHEYEVKQEWDEP